MLAGYTSARGETTDASNVDILVRKEDSVLSGLHHKERWLAFGAALAEEKTLTSSPS